MTICCPLNERFLASRFYKVPPCQASLYSGKTFQNMFHDPHFHSTNNNFLMYVNLNNTLETNKKLGIRVLGSRNNLEGHKWYIQIYIPNLV